MSQERKTIKQYRMEQGISQFQLATLAGISLSAVIGAETGRQLPRIDNAQKIANVFGVTVDEIVWQRREKE